METRKFIKLEQNEIEWALLDAVKNFDITTVRFFTSKLQPCLFNERYDLGNGVFAFVKNGVFMVIPNKDDCEIVLDNLDFLKQTNIDCLLIGMVGQSTSVMITGFQKLLQRNLL